MNYRIPKFSKKEFQSIRKNAIRHTKLEQQKAIKNYLFQNLFSILSCIAAIISAVFAVLAYMK